MPLTPNAHSAIIEPEKLSGYLMSETHPQGAPKWRFLQLFGFTADDPGILREALLNHVAANEASVSVTEYGLKYEVDGPLQTPSRRTPDVRTVWQIDRGQTAPHFVTLRPRR